MKLTKFTAVLLACILSFPAFAYNTDDERIDAYLNVLETGRTEAKQQMLEELQWSGLSDARLFDDIEQRLLTKYNNAKFAKADIEAMNYEMRALGYSGNTKYQKTLEDIQSNRDAKKLHRHAKKALRDLEKFESWNKLIAQSELPVEGKSAEVSTYMKMLNTDNVFVQRLAARVMFHEQLRDKDLLALAASKLNAVYKLKNLNNEEQDTAAWLCKAVGQSGNSEYLTLLAKVTDETPYPKIKKYSSQY